MVKLLIDLLVFLGDCAPLLVSLSIFTLLAILFSRSIRKHSNIYYVVFAIPFLLVLIPYISRLFGVELFNVSRVPFLGSVIRDYIHMGTFGHPLLIIIMYTGALSPKLDFAKRLYSIRKELSIISGFPVLTHSLIRVFNTFPNSLKFFTDNAAYMEKAKVTSELGAGISNFSFVIGIILVILFIPLWVTSFDSIHKRMGNVKWRKFQKWAYVLYAVLFIHAMGIQIGGLMNPRGKNAPQQQVAMKDNAQKQNSNNAQTEIVQSVSNDAQEPRTESIEGKANNGKRQERANTPTEVAKTESDKDQEPKGQSSEGRGREIQEKKADDRPQQQGIKTFTDIKVSQQVKGYIHIFSLILIYGSYLILRLRKAKKDKEKKKARL